MNKLRSLTGGICSIFLLISVLTAVGEIVADVEPVLKENPTNVVFSLSTTNEMLTTTLQKIGNLIDAEIVNEMPALGNMRGGVISLTNVTVLQSCEKMFGELSFNLRSELDNAGKNRLILGFEFPVPKPAPKFMSPQDRSKAYTEVGDKAVFKKIADDELEVFPGFSPELMKSMIQKGVLTNQMEFIPGMTQEEWLKRSVQGSGSTKTEVLPGFSSEELKIRFKNKSQK